MKKDIKRQFRFDPVQIERLEMIVKKMNENEDGLRFTMTDAVQVALVHLAKNLGVDEKELRDRAADKGYEVR